MRSCNPASLKMYKTFLCCATHAFIMQCIDAIKTPDAGVDHESCRKVTVLKDGCVLILKNKAFLTKVYTKVCRLLVFGRIGNIVWW